MKNGCSRLPADLYKLARMYDSTNMSAALRLRRVWMFHSPAQLVCGEIKGNLSLPLYLIEDLIGILIDYADQGLHSGRLFSNHGFVKGDVNKVNAC